MFVCGLVVLMDKVFPGYGGSRHILSCPGCVPFQERECSKEWVSEMPLLPIYSEGMTKDTPVESLPTQFPGCCIALPLLQFP